ncbi:putative dna polymerase zeta catalytic subunit protein [Neocallimastix sp. 'constans']
MSNTTTDPIFSFRIIDADFYVTKPNKFMDIYYSTLYNAEIELVPILRIFGVTKFGQKCCLHIHQVYPYLYIKYSGSLDPDKVNEYMRKLFNSINQVLNMSGSKVRNTHHIYNIELVKGIPFYGFSPNYEHFLKISLLNPNIKKKLVTAFEKGLILGKVFQPYESHIPFKLQVFIDYYLSGFDYIHLKMVHFRYPIYGNNNKNNNIDNNINNSLFHFIFF